MSKRRLKQIRKLSLKLEILELKDRIRELKEKENRVVGFVPPKYAHERSQHPEET